MRSHFVDDFQINGYTFASILEDCVPEPNTGCYLWLGSYDKNGYGTRRFKRQGYNKNWFAHRLSYLLYYGEIEGGKQINHKCDNTSCVNPLHLYSGTQSQNMKDKIGKHKRDFKKGRSPRCILKIEQVKIIKQRHRKGESIISISKDYTEVGYSTIVAICNNQNWKDVQ